MRSAAPRFRRRPACWADAGFSLIEIMMTIAILAILGAIAIPSYSAYAKRSARVEAQALMTTAATRQTQFLVDRRRYADSISALNLTLPASLAGKYTIAIAAVDGPPPAFTITATATGEQAKDKCPTLTISQAGDRTPSTCW